MDLSEMPMMYAAADLFLFPSYQENCPLAPLEAAAAGLPVVFRDIAEYDSLFKGTYLNAKSTQEFIDVTISLLNDPNFYLFSLELSKELIGEFDQEGIKNQLLELYYSRLSHYYQIEKEKTGRIVKW